MAVSILSLADKALNSSDYDLLFTTLTRARSAVVRNIRFVNTSDSTCADLTVAFLRKTGSTEGTARVISPSPVTIPPGAFYAMKEEITLEYIPNTDSSLVVSDEIKAKAVDTGTSTAAHLDCVISGMERDV